MKMPAITLVNPYKCEFYIEEHGDKAHLRYVEYVKKPEDMTKEEFHKLGQNTVDFLKLCLSPLLKSEVEFQMLDDEIKLIVDVEGEKGDIYDMLTSEFLLKSKLAKVTLQEILLALLSTALTLAKEKARP